MLHRKIKYSIVVTFAVLAVIFGIIVWHEKNSSLRVIFLDIGQGDSILISQGSQQLLIDGGKDGGLLLEKLGKYIPFWDRSIEAIIATHPDQDHIGGLIDVMGAYGVNSIIETKMQSQSQTCKALEERVRQLAEKKQIEKIEAKKNVIVKFSSGATVEILYPLESITDVNGKDTNMYSIVARLTIGESRFLFTGDLPTTEENKLLENNIDVSADFLKVAHHGSKYSTSSTFLKAVKPTDAVVSVGKNNSYGHPNPEVLQRLFEQKVNVLRTDESGDIIYDCKNSNDKCLIVR